MTKHYYTVTIPIAGSAVIEVEADSEDEAKEMAFDQVTTKDIDTWEPLEQFNQGNVCYCPRPWQVEIVDEGEVDP